MFRRGLALCAVLGIVSVANAGAVVTLVPGLAPETPAGYNGGETFVVDVKLAQNPAGSDTYLRGTQFDFNASNPAIVKNSFSFDYSSQLICTMIPGLCGSGHSKFESLTDSDGAVVSLIFTGTALDTFNQLKLPGSGPITIGHLNVTLPSVPGNYLLDAMNTAQSDGSNKGAYLKFDFTTTQTWTGANQGLSGGQLPFHVVPEPATLILLGLGGVAAAARRRMA